KNVLLRHSLFKEAFHDVIEMSSFAVVAEELPHQNSPYACAHCAFLNCVHGKRRMQSSTFSRQFNISKKMISIAV
ncbi:hypothetical protein, partial [Siminovitchia terrae]|uniref:hypothetical protein n=1 Tax=Siminovitchia terrae TaxID=1914933 RepID=UPI0028A6C176